MRGRDRNRLLLPGEEKGDRLPRPFKVVLFLFILAGMFAAIMNQCSVPEARVIERKI